ncbi:putative YkwD family protein/spore coat assembly protein SafA [Salirhabdus euzebyi]|uniref:Putative YkwD family protein/spore coat assembly protein SafA n=1 Tax=Salirhabdus euzebyi TaxID=394506 RepID=A0A841PSP5_9BACI|nr:SafA/ExsA family spore coat assembly protein [Salirhabdus euzebyi]MBB6451810.1 putative YkwD family protein/spore coat assembly protein SafA [Salirhabdus euzebyi]
MKKLVVTFGTVILMLTLLFQVKTSAQTDTYTVQPGDSLWKISVRYQIGLSEIISANPQFKNPNLIYPGDKVTIPLTQGTQSVEEQVAKITNNYRAQNGLPALTFDWQLARVARYKSVDMRDQGYFAHDSPTYGSPFTMIKNFGISYTRASENIAAGQRTPDEVVRSWMNSPGHKKNILDPNVTHIGVGYAKGGSYGHYWTQMFIKK